MSKMLATLRTRIMHRLKSLGFSQGKQANLYGRKFDIIRDPIVMTPTLAFMDAIDSESGEPRRVRIPITILNMAAVR